jgi:hypothetical protein
MNIAHVDGSGTGALENKAAETAVVKAGVSRNPRCPPSKKPYPTMSPTWLIPTAWVSLQADPNIAPRFVAFPDGDHNIASSPLAVKE